MNSGSVFSIPIIVPSKTLISENFQELFQLKGRFYTPFLGYFFSHFTKTLMTFAKDIIKKFWDLILKAWDHIKKTTKFQLTRIH